jgi:quinol monooxygenase YgiN
MAEPVVFISRFRVKAGTVDALRRYASEATEALERDKPRTVVFAMYLDEQAGRASIVHAFGDSEAMDAHFEGAADRSAAAYEFLQPEGWDVYGAPSEQAMATLRQAAETAGVTLGVWPTHVSGFVHAAV